MEKIFSVGKTAKIVGMTAETLRHYDREGLVRPCKTDRFTGYRYYSEKEIVALTAVKALKQMDLSLAEIKQILSLGDIGNIIGFLKKAEESADKKIDEINDVKRHIARARRYYEGILKQRERGGSIFEKYFEKRTILLSQKPIKPELDTLHDYHRHYFAQVGGLKDKFSFTDEAGVYEKDGSARMFAVCEKYCDTEGLIILPEGEYLCADCTGDECDETLRAVSELAAEKYAAKPDFAVKMVVVTGILQWDYQIQLYVGPPPLGVKRVLHT